MYKLKTQVNLEAAHRLYQGTTFSKECHDNLHGHSYKVTIVISRKTLNDVGMVVDFKLLKSVLNECLEKRYDHCSFICFDDPIADSIFNNCRKVCICPCNPTAEYMSEKFAYEIMAALQELDSELILESVSVQETDNNIAIWERDK